MIKTLASRCCNNAGLAGYKLHELLHRVWVSSESNLQLGDIFSTPFFLVTLQCSQLSKVKNDKIVGG